ncbi:MAG: hypothetical protein Q9170_005337 [Blastenia crenularia]
MHVLWDRWENQRSTIGCWLVGVGRAAEATFAELTCAGVLGTPLNTVWRLLEDLGSTYQDNLATAGLLGDHFGIPGLPASYDYIIVGGGTAGITLACRLAANTSITVALVEAGGFYETDNGNQSQIPADAVKWLEAKPVFRIPLIDWYQFTTPQDRISHVRYDKKLIEPLQGFGGRSVHYASGKTLGGGSARNFLWYMRSSIGAYQNWAHQVQDISYSFANLDPYFRRSVHINPPTKSGRPKNASVLTDLRSFSASGGPVQVSYPVWVNGISSWFASALRKLGLPQVPGFVDGNLHGFAYIAQTSTTDQVRSSSESSFLREALEKTTNLQLYKSTIATKIVFDASNKAIGIEAQTGEFVYLLNARREVILSAGAVSGMCYFIYTYLEPEKFQFRSPQLLMTSGIGRCYELSVLSIPCISNRPGVGKNMWDHVLLGQAYAVNLETHSQLMASPAYLKEAIAMYNSQRQGILTNPGADFVAFEKLPEGSISATTRNDLDSTFGPDWPDIELLPFDNDLVSLPTDGRSYVSSLVALVAPFSRGNVTISSTSTLVNPIVSPNWLTDPRDVEVAIAGFKRARQIFDQPAIHGITSGGEFSPGANVTSDSEILDFIRKTSTTISHAAGTCQMGTEGERSAVVDSRCRVYGVRGLRVVDASAFPILPPGHPQGTVCKWITSLYLM